MGGRVFGLHAGVMSIGESYMGLWHLSVSATLVQLTLLSEDSPMGSLLEKTRHECQHAKSNQTANQGKESYEPGVDQLRIFILTVTNVETHK